MEKGEIGNDIASTKQQAKTREIDKRQSTKRQRIQNAKQSRKHRINRNRLNFATVYSD